MFDEMQWQADRIQLQSLLLEHPDWSCTLLAQTLHRSVAQVKKWRKRIREAGDQASQILQGLSSRRHHPTPPKPSNPFLVERIFQIRDHPPQNLGRTPGPKAIIYYLKHDPLLKEKGLKPPNSTSFIWKILDMAHRIARPKTRHAAEPATRHAPYSCWQAAYKDSTTITVGPEGKKAHLVEILNIVDEGTSILVEAIAREDYNAETALAEVSKVFKRAGLPKELTIDRDPRWVGSQSMRDFPSAFVRFCHCLDIQVKICLPRRPDQNGFVERYNGSFGRECLAVHRPESLERVKKVTAQYKEHYNQERPHQGLSCKNQPPRVAFPELPALRTVPLLVDPDRWLKSCEGKRYVRKVDSSGTIKIDKQHYYIGKEWVGKYVQAEVVASSGELVIWNEKEVIKRVGIKGLQRQEVNYEGYVTLMLKEARSERRLAALRARAKQGILFDQG